MRKNLLTLSLLMAFSGIAQQRTLSYHPSDLPIFIDKSGDTLTKALLGGLNQPQFQTLDINNDGKKDLFVYDRTGHQILPFINVGNNDITTYKYSPKYVSCFPKLENFSQSTWVLFADYNNDGKEDLWTSVAQRTVLFRNITKPNDKAVKFQKVSPYLKAYHYSGTDDSVNFSASFYNRPTIGDVDGDGDVDFFSYQASENNFILYRNMTKDFGLPIDPPVFDRADLCWGSFRDTAFDKIWLNKDCPDFYKLYRKKHGAGSTVLWFDNDNDGDMDMLMGNADGKNMIFLKNGKKDFDKKLDTMIAFEGHWPQGTIPVELNSFPAAFMLDANGDGIRDIIVAPNQEEETSPLEQTQQVWFYKNNGSNSFPDFKLEKKNYFTDEFLDHGSYSDPVLHDIDGDKDLDLIIASNGDHAKTGNQNDRLFYYKNIGTKSKPVFKLENEDMWGLSSDSIRYLSVAFGDLNGDGKTDMVAGNYFGSLYFYKNIGSSTTWAFTTPIRNYANVRVGQRSTPQIIDLDKDGLLDLVIGEREGNFNYFRNTGSTANAQFTLIDDTLGNFITNELILTGITASDTSLKDTLVYSYTGNAVGKVADLDGDGKFDMVFGGEEGKIRVMKFNTFNQLKYIEDTSILFDSAYMSYKTMDYGNNSRPAIGDLDGDSIPDIIVGNDRGGLCFLKGKVEKTVYIETYKRNQPFVYPNPNNGAMLNINKRTSDEFTFSLFDMSGKLIKSETSESSILVHKMSLGAIKDGVYILQSKSKNNITYYTRVIVSRF